MHSETEKQLLLLAGGSLALREKKTDDTKFDKLFLSTSHRLFLVHFYLLQYRTGISECS